MSMQKDHSFFQQGGYVSVWIGRLSSDEELDRYLNMTPEFENEFGFKLNEADMPETTVVPEAVLVDMLVDGFSWAKSFRDAVIGSASTLGFETANTMIVFYNFKYDPTDVKVKPSTKLLFLGAFPFS
jgi:hypothetical protein